MFPNMDSIGIALARIFEVFERIAVALERIAATMESEHANNFDQDIMQRIKQDTSGRGSAFDE